MMYRISGRLGSRFVRICGANLGIPLFVIWNSNIVPLSGQWTVSDGQFDWGGRLLNGNGGVQRFPQDGWKPSV